MRRGRASQSGESLVEIVVSVAILGVGVVALLGGMGTAVLTSSVHRAQVDVGAVLTATAERVKAAPYVACATRDTYLPPPFTHPGWTGGAPTFTIADWNGAVYMPRLAAPPPPLKEPCRQLEELGHREQRITLTFTSAERPVSETLTIIKRFRDCPKPAAPTQGCG